MNRTPADLSSGKYVHQLNQYLDSSAFISEDCPAAIDFVRSDRQIHLWTS